MRESIYQKKSKSKALNDSVDTVGWLKILNKRWDLEKRFSRVDL